MTIASIQAAADSPATTERIDIRKVVAASMAGTIAEWYEFFIYGVAATLVFGQLFFPKVDGPLSGIIAAFATYAVGFAARPLGGIVFGHFGDRFGRKKLLQFSLLLVGLSTFLMGCIPSFASIGFWAPAILVFMRFVQGFAVGGEWGGAVLLVSEHSPSEQRGFWASFPQAAACAGNVLASIVLFSLSFALSSEDFLSWGWRVAFWLSAVIIFIGYYIRRTVEDAPIFLEAQKKHATSIKQSASIKEVLLKYPKQLLLGTLIRVGENTVYYAIVVFTITYLTTQVKMPFYTVLLVMFIANIFQFFAMLYGGHLSDRIGRKRCILIGYLGLIPWAFAYFWVLDSGDFLYVTLAVCVGLFFQALCYAPEAAIYSEIFPTRMRYSGASFCYQISSIFAGSIAPLVATILLRNYAATLPIVIYLLGVIALSLGALALLRETRNISLHDVDAEHGRIHGH